MITSNGANVIVHGTGGGGDTTGSVGVLNAEASVISATGSGSLSVTGIGGSGNSNGNLGVLNLANIVTSSGSLSISGTGGNGSGPNNHGVQNSETIQSTSANIAITGIGGTSSGFGITTTGIGTVTTAASNTNITLTTDSIDLGSLGPITAGTGTITIQNRTAGTLINLGGADVLTGSPLTLGLDDFELDSLTAGSLVIGNTAIASGDITVSAALTPASVRNFVFNSGNDILFNADFTNGGAGSINAKAKRHVNLATNADLTSSTGAFQVTLNSNSDATSGGAIELASGATIVSNGGNITLGGGSSPSTTNAIGESTQLSGVSLATGSQINAGGGNILIRGTGASSGAGEANGILATDAAVLTSGSGTIQFVGTGGAGTGPNKGISLAGTTAIDSAAGHITFNGTGGSGTSGNVGVAVASTSSVETTGGNITVTGTGGGGNSNGFANDGAINATGSGQVTLTGTGTGNGTGVINTGTISTANGTLAITGTTGSGSGTDRVGVNLTGTVSSTGAAINITGTGGPAIISGNFGIISGGSINTSVGNTNITLTADSIDISGGSINSGTGITTLQNRTAGMLIHLGAADVSGDPDSILGLTDAELDLITAGTLIIGNTGVDSGDIGVVAAVTPANVRNFIFNSGDDVHISDDFTIGGAGSLIVRAKKNIEVNASADITSTTGAFNVTLNSDRDANNSGSIVVGFFSSIVTNGGNIVLGGGADPLTTGAIATSPYFQAVEVSDSTLNAGGGNISIRGLGQPGVGNTDMGVVMYGSNIATTGSGNITIVGQSGDANSTIAGVSINGTTITAGNTGNIAITGTGLGPANGSFLQGVDIFSGSSINTTGGNISITGAGGSGTGGNNDGVRMRDTTVSTTGSGAITITGTGGTGDGNSNFGIEMLSPVSLQTAGGLITLNGTGGGGIGTGNYGVITDIAVSFSGGSIAITGVSSSGNLGISSYGLMDTSAGNHAITLTSDSVSLANGSINAGTGTVTIQNRTAGTLIELGGADVLSGTLKLGLTDTEIDRITAGLLVLGNTTVASGDITVAAAMTPANVRNVLLNSGNDILFDADFTNGGAGSMTAKAKRNIILGNDADLTTLSGAFHVTLNSDSDASSGGAIKLDTDSSIVSNGGDVKLGGGADPSLTAAIGSGSLNSGVELGTNSSIVAGGGTITILGQGMSSPAGIYSNGVHMNGATVSTTGSGDIVITGVGLIDGSNQSGVQLHSSTITGGSTGSVTVTGTGGGGSAPGDHGNVGVLLFDSGAKITSLGGNVNVTGTGGLGAGGFNVGVVINTGAEISATGTGVLTIIGTGGTGNGDANDGVSNVGLISSANGNINITGTGGTGTGLTNRGINSTGSIASTGGAISLTGIGGSQGTAGSVGINLQSASSISTAASSSPITLTTNSIALAGTVNAGTGTVRIQNRTAGTLINLGAADVLTGTPMRLGVTDAEIDRVLAGLLVIGNTSVASGDITVSSAMTPANVYNFEFNSGNDIFFNADFTAGGVGSLNAKANRDITLGNNADITSSAGAFNVTLNSDRDATGGGGILLDTNATIVTLGGNVILGGGSTPASTAAIGVTQNHGVRMNSGSSIAASGGNISIRGQGNASVSDNVEGVSLSSAAISTTGSGNITVHGVAAGAASNNHGVHLLNATITGGTSGAVLITGVGSASGVGSVGTNYGVYLEGASAAITTLGASIGVEGTGGNGDGGSNLGVMALANTQISAAGNGHVTITGVGGTNTGSHNFGIGIYGSISANTGNINLHGTGGGGSGDQNEGVVVQGTISNNGPITITGIGGALGTTNSYGVDLGGTITTQASNQPITLNTDSYIGIASIDAGSGIITLQNRTAGTAINIGGADNLAPSSRVLGILDAELDAFSAGTVVIGNASLASGDITISSAMTPALARNFVLHSGNDILFNADFTNGGTGSLNAKAKRDVILGNDADITSSTGAFHVTLNADSDATGGGGIYLDTDSSIVSNGGNIILGGGAAPGSVAATGTAIAGPAGTNDTGIGIFGASLVAGGGNISIRGAANPGSLIFANGVWLNGATVSTTGSGTIEIFGTGGANGVGALGVIVEDSSITGGSTGSTNITGTGGGQSRPTSSSNVGVVIGGSATTVTTAGGNLNISGTGGTGSGGSNAGIAIDSAVGTTGSGVLTLVGTGGSGDGDSVIGVLLDSGSSLTSANGPISITGVAGTGTGADNMGIVATGSISSSGATITLTGTGGTFTHVNGYGIQNTGTINTAASNSAITFNANNINLSGGSVTAGTGTVNIRTLAPSHYIQLGVADNIGLILGLIDSELDRITAGQLVITNNVTGTGVADITIGSGVGGTISPANVANLVLHASRDVSFGTMNITMPSAGSLNVLANRNIHGTGSTITSTTGALNITLNSDRDATGGGAIFLDGNGGTSPLSILSNGGNIVFGGGADPTTAFATGTDSTTYRTGIRLVDGVTLNAGGGNVTLFGKGFAGSAGNTKRGIEIIGSDIITTGSGNIFLEGRSVSTDGHGGAGIRVDDSIITTQTGNIAMNGYGSTASPVTGYYNIGLHLGTGSITSSGGNIDLYGVGGAGESGLNDGIANAMNISTTGSGTIQLQGFGGHSNDVGRTNFGVANSGSISTANGTLTIYGTAGTSIGDSTSRGIYNFGNITSTGSSIFLHGLAGTSSADTRGFEHFSGTISTGAAHGVIEINTDTAVIGSAINAAGNVYINNVTAGTLIDLGGTDINLPGTRQLGLTDTELDFITGFRLFLGSSSLTPGDITVSAAISPANANHLVLYTAEDVHINNSLSMPQSVIIVGDQSTNIGSSGSVTTTNGDITIATSRFVNNGGASALAAGGTGKHWSVWSENPDPAGGSTPDVRGGLDFDFIQYNAVWGLTTPAATGNAFFYSIAPTADVTFVGPVSKVYDGLTNAPLTSSNFSTTGLVGSDSVVFPTSGVFNNENAGNNKLVTISPVYSIANNGKPVFGYVINPVNNSISTGQITPAIIGQILGVTASDRLFDGTSIATLNTSGIVYVGLLSGDNLMILQANFDSINVGLRTVDLAGLVLGGSDVGNYVLATNINSASPAITARIVPHLTIEDINSRLAYDGFIRYEPNTAAMPITNSVIIIPPPVTSSVAVNFPQPPTNLAITVHVDPGTSIANNDPEDSSTDEGETNRSTRQIYIRTTPNQQSDVN